MGFFEIVTDEAVDHGRPYRAYIPSRLQAIPLSLSPVVARKVDRASRQIAQIDTRLGGSPSLPALAALVKSEAIASSYIEGHRISADDLARQATDPRTASADVRAVMGNIEATHRAVRFLSDPSRPISIEDIVRIQSDLMETHPRGGSRSPFIGLRTSQAVLIPPGAVRGESASMSEATHIPPPASRVGGAMADLIDYINSAPTDAPPLVRAALAHAQFETIHPFPDGNGRTGRALIQAMLRRDGAVKHITLPLSPYLAMNPRSYVDGLNAVRFDGDEPDQHALGQWFENFADCAYSAAANAKDVADHIDDIGADWTDRLRHDGARTGATAYGAVNYLLGAVATTARDLAFRLNVGEGAARTALHRLERIGALSASKSADGSVVFVADSVADVIGRSQRDIEVISAPRFDAAPIADAMSTRRRPSLDDSGAGARANPRKVCGAWMPRSRAHCNLPEGHAGWPQGGHRHLRR